MRAQNVGHPAASQCDEPESTLYSPFTSSRIHPSSQQFNERPSSQVGRSFQSSYVSGPDSDTPQMTLFTHFFRYVINTNNGTGKTKHSSRTIEKSTRFPPHFYQLS
jgi:hypothetical protein